MLICEKTICFDDVINKTTICKIVIYEESTCCSFSGTLWKKIYVIPISSSNLLKFLEERKSEKILATIIWFHNPSSNFFGWWMRACILITIITHELLPAIPGVTHTELIMLCLSSKPFKTWISIYHLLVLQCKWW